MSEYCVNCKALAIRLVRLEGLQKILDLERIERMHHAEQDHDEHSARLEWVRYLQVENKRLREALENVEWWGKTYGNQYVERLASQALRELPLGGEAGMKTTHNGTKHQHLGAGADNSEQGEGER